MQSHIKTERWERQCRITRAKNAGQQEMCHLMSAFHCPEWQYVVHGKMKQEAMNLCHVVHVIPTWTPPLLLLSRNMVEVDAVPSPCSEFIIGQSINWVGDGGRMYDYQAGRVDHTCFLAAESLWVRWMHIWHTRRAYQLDGKSSMIVCGIQ